MFSQNSTVVNERALHSEDYTFHYCNLEFCFRLAKNAEKIPPCGSSQLNENFNKIVSSKHPKDRHYAGSESLEYRCVLVCVTLFLRSYFKI